MYFFSIFLVAVQNAQPSSGQLERARVSLPLLGSPNLRKRCLSCPCPCLPLAFVATCHDFVVLSRFKLPRQMFVDFTCGCRVSRLDTCKRLSSSVHHRYNECDGVLSADQGQGQRGLDLWLDTLVYGQCVYR